MANNEALQTLDATWTGEPVALEHDTKRLIRRLERHGPLRDEERDEIMQLPMRIRSYPADHDVIREGDRPSECALVLEGFLFRHKSVPDGRRQILSFHPPADIPDLQSLFLRNMDHSIGTLVASKVGFIPHGAIRDLIGSRSALALALWRETLVETAIAREWMVGLGRRSAYQRVAHLLCEVGLRLEAVGLGTRTRFDFPATQSEVADALGMSTVHANRVVQELRRTKMVVWRGPSVTVQDWAGLAEAGEFNPAYLHGEVALA